jgi:DNA-binding response OmpR family regulator
LKKILVVEDDADIAAIERDFLEMNGFTVTVASDGLEGLRLALTGEFDLILLDLMLPGMDGIEVCKRIRNAVDVPILMATAKVEEADRLRGLGIGADDYISKPFSFPELVARVKTHLTRYERLTIDRSSRSKEISAGDVRINPETRRVYVDEQEVDLKNKEYELLLFLASNADVVFSRETLYERIWGMDAVGDIITVSVHIKRLREKIERDPSNPVHIQTVWGAGYRFKA